MTARTKGLLFTTALVFVVLFGQYGRLLRSPNAYMFSTDGDGMKNYFSFAWHVEHDTTVLTFSGMNAPFGEHINYPDAQPLFSNGWRAVDAAWPEASAYSVVVVNLLMVFSLLLSAVFLCLILLRQGVAWPVGAFAAVVIALMSMQVLRGVQAHYALAYSWCIPVCIWAGLVHWEKQHAGRSAVFIWALLSAWLWVHVYLGFIACAGLFLWGLYSPASGTDRKKKWTLMAAPVMALVLFQGVMLLTDTHAGRTEHPYGFFEYHINAATLLTPDHMWDSPLTERLFGGDSAEVAENWAYLGMGVLLMIATLLAAGSVALFRPAKRKALLDILRAAGGGRMTALFCAGTVLLLLAFALPFSLGLGGPSMEDPGDPLKFRAPGRFAWFFHFALSIQVVLLLWHWQRLSGQRTIRWVPRGILALALSLGAYEAWHLHAFIGEEATNAPNYFNQDLLPEDMKKMVAYAGGSNAVGIASLPYFHNGAEELMVPVDEEGLLLGQAVAYHSGIPMLSSSLTRTALEEVRAGIQAFGPTWYERPELPPWTSTDTLLVLIAGPLENAYDRAVLERTQGIVDFGTHRMGKLSVGDLLRDDREAQRKEWAVAMQDLPREGPWATDTTGHFFLYDGFEERSATRSMTGSGAYSGLKKDFNVLTRIAPNTLDTGRSYIASFWYYDRGPMRCHSFIGIDEKDLSTDEGWWDHYTDGRFSRTLSGDWSLIELPFTLRDPAHQLQLFITGRYYYPDSLFVDELWIREAGRDVLRTDADGTLWRNGHYIAP